MKQKRKYPIIFYFIRVCLYIFVSLLSLILISYLLLRSSFVQNYLANKTAEFLSSELKTEVKVGGVDVNYFLDIVLEDLLVKDLHKDTLVYSSRLIADIEDVWLGKNKIEINRVTLKNSYINLKKYKSDSALNMQFILNYFNPPTAEKDTSSSAPWKVILNSIELKDNRFDYCIEKSVNDTMTQEGIINFNDLSLRSLNVKMDDLILNGDTIGAAISNLSFVEKSGLWISEFSANAKMLPGLIEAKKLKLRTPNSNLKLDFSMQYKDFTDFNDFLNKVKLDADFDSTMIGMPDLHHFVKTIPGYGIRARLDGRIYGTIADLFGKNVWLTYGANTRFHGDFVLKGLPDINNTFVDLNLKQLRTNRSDIEGIDIPLDSRKQLLPILYNIALLGIPSFSGRITGMFDNLTCKGQLNTDIGIAGMDINLKNIFTPKNVLYNGSLMLTDFFVGRFINQEKYLGRTSLDLQIDGRSFDVNYMVAKVNGQIHSIELNGYAYKNIEVSGDIANNKYTGHLMMNDENAKLEFDGKVDMAQKIPQFVFDASVARADLNKIKLIQSDSVFSKIVYSEISCNFTGDKIDNMKGNITIAKTLYRQNDNDFILKRLELNTTEYDSIRTIKLLSDYVDANFTGKFTFTSLPASMMKLLNKFLPSYSIPEYDSVKFTRNENLKFVANLKNTDTITKLFIPYLSAGKNTQLSGDYNFTTSVLNFKGSSPELKYQSQRMQDWYFNAKIEGKKLFVNTGSSKFFIQEGLALEKFHAETSTYSDSVLFTLGWKKKDSVENSGDFKGYVSFAEKPRIIAHLNRSQLVLSDSIWNITDNSRIIIDSSSISIGELYLTNKQQAIRIRGKIADNMTDSLQVAFSEFNLASLNTLTKKSGYELGGIVNGSASVNDLYKTMNLTSGLNITNLVVNNDVLGNAAISTTWNNQKKGVGVNATIFRGPLKTFDVNGTYYPTGEKLDFDISLDKFKLNMLRSYVKSFATINKGIATGNMKLVGTASDPDLSGMLELQQVNLRVDYLNAVFSFADKIEIKKDAFILNGLTLNDTVGNKAVVTGQITHNRFKDFYIDLSISANNLACLNTNVNMNNMFYGKASITGMIGVTGPPENIRIDIDAKTEKNTQLFIPISSSTEASDNSFIRFVGSEKSSKSDDSYLPDLSGLQMNFDFEVTPEAELQIILDQKAGDIIRSRGNGNLNMNINTLGDFKMFGDYIIEDGDYLFTMENIINKKFKVKQGGSLKWNGDPYDADMDLEAVYDLKASVYNLSLDIDTSKKKVPVACKIYMTNKLFNPSINFDIDFPGMDDFAKEQYKAVIKPDLSKQVFSLLVLANFVSPSSLQGVGAITANSGELLSNQLTNWLSQISKEFDIGVNYRPGDEISRDEVEVALSTQLFNDRVSIDGNFGVAGQQQAASNIVGDVNIEAKPFKKGNLKLKAYNKTNTSNDQFKKNSPYTQGMGLFYRKEFNSFRELFKRKKKEKNSK